MIVYPGVGSLSSSHWELMGDAMVTTEQVRLTPDMQSRQGAVWSRIVSIYLRILSKFLTLTNALYSENMLKPRLVDSIFLRVFPALSSERLGDAGAL